MTANSSGVNLTVLEAGMKKKNVPLIKEVNTQILVFRTSKCIATFLEVNRSATAISINAKLIRA